MLAEEHTGYIGLVVADNVAITKDKGVTDLDEFNYVVVDLTVSPFLACLVQSLEVDLENGWLPLLILLSDQRLVQSNDQANVICKQLAE